MADFLRKSQTKTAVRELASPIAEVTAFRKNEQEKKVFWILFIAIADLVLARVVDPLTAQQIVGIITGIWG